MCHTSLAFFLEIFKEYTHYVNTTDNFSDSVFHDALIAPYALLTLILILSARLAVQNKRRDNAFTPHNSAISLFVFALKRMLLSLCCRKSVLIGLAAWRENGTEIKLNIDGTFAPAAFIKMVVKKM